MSNDVVPVASAMRGFTTIGDGSPHLGDITQYDLLRLRRPANDMLKLDLIGDNHHMANFFPPEKGHKYVSQINPTLASVKPLLEKMKGPSVLWLRGCDSLLQLHNIVFERFPFEKFMTLTILEISGVGGLTIVPDEIPEMTRLQSLNLSHLPIQQLPDDFFSNLTNLRSLVLKSCPNLQSLPKLPTPSSLEFLDLSYLLIESLPEGFFSDLKELTSLILRGCSKLHSLPSTKALYNLKVLDLSHCISLRTLQLDIWGIDVLDLSYTDIQCITAQTSNCFTHMFCRDANGSTLFNFLASARLVKVLDLSGAQHLGRTIQFKEPLYYLKALDLSRTSIESIDFTFHPFYLYILSLKECRSLVKLPATNILRNLRVLDISSCESLCDLPGDFCELEHLKELNLSGCSSLRELRDGIFDRMSGLEKLDLSNTNFCHLPSFAKLDNRGTRLILSRNLLEKLPDFSSLKNLNLEIVEEVASGGSHEIENIHPITSEFHLVSTFDSSESAFYLFKENFDRLKYIISQIQEKTEATDVDFERMLADLDYILAKFDLLESTDDHKGSIKKLLRDLVYVVEHMNIDEFTALHSTKLNKLYSSVSKLKLLVPPRLKQESEKEMKDPRFTWQHEEDARSDLDIGLEAKQRYRSSYESLTETQRNCLLYFAATPRRIVSLEIMERNLIHLWWGEGFITDDPQQQQNASEKGLVEQAGLIILEVLHQKGFILRFPSGYCDMNCVENALVREQAKSEHFFDFDDDPEVHWVTPQFTGSQRACLLKSRSKFPSSCELWFNYANSSQNLECFKNMRTLFNVNERNLNIRAEWISKMPNLSVVHLGRWDKNEENIELVDLNFLEEFKNMKQLRLLSFEGVSAISKLPDSICKITSLKMLNLRECSDLEELPVGIGSLANLVHLDCTLCPLLSMVPKGIKLLSKLEVLKGFVITYEVDGQQNKKACTLADLVKLEKLRKLGLVVNIDRFPNSEDLRAFKEMKNLCNLKITWVKNNYIERKASKPSRWQQLKCWEQRTPRNETGEPLRSSCCFDNLKKMVLCCMPLETAPEWLNPSELHSLKKLYIIGGHLKMLPGNGDQNTWNVKTLRLEHTLKLDIDWDSLREIFPNMTYLRKLPNDHLSTFPVSEVFGLWTNEDGEDKEGEEARYGDGDGDKEDEEAREEDEDGDDV